MTSEFVISRFLDFSRHECAPRSPCPCCFRLRSPSCLGRTARRCDRPKGAKEARHCAGSILGSLPLRGGGKAVSLVLTVQPRPHAPGPVLAVGQMLVLAWPGGFQHSCNRCGRGWVWQRRVCNLNDDVSFTSRTRMACSQGPSRHGRLKIEDGSGSHYLRCVLTRV